MLYITTRNNKDAYTVHRTLTENFAVDGGGYVPFQMPVLDSCELESFASKSFGESVATILNLFFTPKMTGWDVEFSIGRSPIKLLSLNGKITVAELFSNPEGNYSYFVKALYDHILQNNSRAMHPTVWAEISIRIATLFGVWSEILKQGVISSQDLIDISLSANEYHTYIAAVYARKLGLPIDEEEMLWRIKALLRRAQIASERRIVVGRVILDYDSMTVSRNGKTQELPQKEFLLLYKLLSYPGKIFTRIQLMDEIWGADSETGWETVTVHIGRLRKRFEGWSEFEIVSVRGLGYKAVKKV